MDVKRIPVDVQRLLSATARINNYKTAVQELVYNSLDADSTCIAIRLHIQNNWVQVVDNGHGIKKADYHLLGERYATSKLHDTNTLKAVPHKYGYQGQALANIIEVSKAVKITSRYSNSNDTWIKTIVEGKTEGECFRAPMRPSKGTTVEIDGFLYNLNIQKKCINAFNELQDIKTMLEQLLLIFNNVSISLRDDSENEIIFKMHKNRDVYQILKSLFNIDKKDVQELQVEKNVYKVKAYICNENSDINKNCRWIYLNNTFIQISNLHKIISNKFAKTKCMKHKETKTARAYDKEAFVACQCVPFYFLFITCPYYDYDIVNFGKKTSIEFKDWVQINNLIEKLVKFYNGDVKSINVQKNDNQMKVSKNVDTRDEIKKIIDKILAKPNKASRISQMQNGIKGKRVRRKKKQQMNISLSKIVPLKSKIPYKGPENVVKEEVPNNKIIKKTAVKFCDIQLKLTENIAKFKNKANKKINKISKTSLKCKCNKKHDNIMEIFKNGTNSIKRRCSELSCDVKDYLRFKNCKAAEDINKIRNKSPAIESEKENYFVKDSKININTQSKEIVEYKSINNCKKSGIEKITSYDLLHTVIKTQRGFDQGSMLEVQRRTYTRNYYHPPKLTFESHKYAINSTLVEKKLPPTVQFISKQSRNNFNIGIHKHNENSQIKAGKITKQQGSFDAERKKKHNINKSDKLLNIYQKNALVTSFSIDTSQNDIVAFSKQIRNQVINDMNSIFDNSDKISCPKSQLNFGVNLNVEKTYTIIVDSYYDVSQAFNVPRNCKSNTDEIVNNIKVSHDAYTKSKSNIMFMSEPQHTSELNVYDPLDVCETILNSSKKIEDELNNSFTYIEKKGTSLIIKESRNIEDLLNRSNTNRSQIFISESRISSQENCAAVPSSKENEENNGSVTIVNNESPNQIRCSNEKIGSLVTDTIQNNSVYNFKLNTRNRFMPKGMSQIFKNCFSKNICSYNLDTEYYENTIYNNFVDDVAVNSEIFEPRVQNLKEFATGDIQKVTEKLKQRNADLIFGTESLRSAKVVLGQVDCKFIAAVVRGFPQTDESPGYLVFFDQHAVHERIRLEKKISYYLNDNIWKKVTIDTLSLKGSSDEIVYLHNHKDKFTQFGLEWTVFNNSEILVNSIPEAIRGENPRPVEIIKKAVKELIFEQMHAIKYQKGNVSIYPQSIMNLVFSEACRYAIKFGDNLSLRDCVELIAALADCKTPFQCAHGRPVMAVMVELKNEQIEYKVNMESIMQFKNRIKM